MLAAVRNPGRYALNGYLFSDGVPASSSGDGWSNPSKSDAVPGGAIPTPTITASAAHPGRKSNNTIPYTRVTSLDSARLAGKPGDVSFVSRIQSGYSGAGTERKSLMASIEYLNIQLSERDDGRTTLRRNLPGGGTNSPFEWRDVRELENWCLDGIILGNPDMSNSNPTNNLVDGVLDGTQVMNICVQGIASALNVYLPDQSATMRIAPLDDVFIGLFYEIHANHFSFRYEPFSSAALYCPELGLINVNRLVGAYHVGKVIDCTAAKGGWGGRSGKSEHRITLNVNIEWVGVKPEGGAWYDHVTGFMRAQPTLLDRWSPYEQCDPTAKPPPVVVTAPTAPGPLVPAQPLEIESVSSDEEEEPPPPPPPGDGVVELVKPPPPPPPPGPPPGPPPEPFVDPPEDPPEEPAPITPGQPSPQQVAAAADAAEGEVGYDTTQGVVNGYLNNPTSPLDAQDRAFLTLNNEKLARWSLDFAEVVRFVRNGGTGVPGQERVAEWLVLHERIRRALARQARS